MRTRTQTRAALAMAIMLAGGLSGCRQTLFRERDDMTIYDRPDRIRGEGRDWYRYNEYGRRVPNIRGRLARDERSG